MVTNGAPSVDVPEGQFAHAPQAPARRSARRCQQRRARNAAAARAIKMAMVSCMEVRRLVASDRIQQPPAPPGVQQSIYSKLLTPGRAGGCQLCGNLYQVM